MAFNPGRNVGRLSIRVVPDTKQFRRDLKRQLDQIERTTSATIRVDRANLDKVKIREDIRRQMNDLRGVNIDAAVRVTVDRARLKKMALRKSIQAQFDKFDNIRVNIEASIKNQEHFEKEVRDMVQRASRNKVKIDVAAMTAAATTQMRWLSRDRFVNLIVKVSKTSVVSALATLAALSGARLSWKWIDTLIDKFKELDRNLPSILGWTTGITSGIAALFAATSGLVGIGQGLFAITPALLVLPGLFLNALGSLTALVVALKNANTELAPLSDHMSELGDIINAGFWGSARQPIIDLVNNLMPQLRVAFHDLSTGIGEFTGAMSRAFGKELAGGRLASIFKGIADGWRVLGTGADGFAGALVSLSQIAATYTPRLAHWFVRQANTFDKWLKAISEDGRLGRWMEDAIDAMYDVWDVTRGLAGVFAGLWKAADQAGSGGLRGFGQLMLEWRRTVNSADFQRGLAAVFRGSYAAMDAFGNAVKAIGRLVSDNSQAFETFIGSAGTFLGGLIEGIADALNTPLAAKGLNDLSGGLVEALNGVLPHLPRMADTFGNFLGLLGDLAGTLLPTAAAVLGDLMPIIDALIDAVRPVLPKLGDALVDIVDALAPSVTELAKALGPAVVDAIVVLAEALVAVAPLLDPLIRGLTAIVQAIADLLAFMTADITNLTSNKPDPADWLINEKFKVEGLELDIEALADIRLLTRSLEMDEDLGNQVVKGLFKPETISDAQNAANDVASAFLDKYEEVMTSRGKYSADKLVEAIAGSDLPQNVKDTIGRQLNAAGYEYEYFKDLGKASAGQVAKGMSDGSYTIEDSMADWKERFINGFEKNGLQGAQAMWDAFDGYEQDSAAMQGLLDDLRAWGMDIEDVMGDAGAGISTKVFEGLKSDDFHLGLRQSGEDAADSYFDGMSSGGTGAEGFSFTRGIVQGLNDGKPEVKTAADSIWTSIKSVFSGDAGFTSEAGRRVPDGVALGIANGELAVTLAAVGVVAKLQTVFDGAGTWLVGAGQSSMLGFATGITTGSVAAVVASVGVVTNMQRVFATSQTWLVTPGRNTMAGYALGISVGGIQAVIAAGKVRSSIVSAVGGGSLYGVGFNLMAGMASGIRSGAIVAAVAARAAVNQAIYAAKAAAEIHSPSKRTEREIGRPLIQGVGVGIDKDAAGVRRSMVNAVDMSGVSGESPTLNGQGRSNVALHIHNPVVRDLMQDAWDAAQMAGVLA